MSGRHKRRSNLSDAEIVTILKAAEQLHKAVNGPLISVTSDHYIAIRKFVPAILELSKALTGHDTPPWIGYGGTTPSRWAQGLKY